MPLHCFFGAGEVGTPSADRCGDHTVMPRFALLNNLGCPVCADLTRMPPSNRDKGFTASPVSSSSDAEGDARRTILVRRVRVEGVLLDSAPLPHVPA